MLIIIILIGHYEAQSIIYNPTQMLYFSSSDKKIHVYINLPTLSTFSTNFSEYF
jgi:hypothetical protein